MDLQQRTSRRSKHSSRRKARPLIVWSPLFLARLAVLALVAIVPWFQGGVNWSAQYWMNLATLLILGLLGLEAVDRIWKGIALANLQIPKLSLGILAVAGYAWCQTLPLFAVDGTSGWVPNSVQIQRWFLGQPNPTIANRLGVDHDLAQPELARPYDGELGFGKKLAVSVEPLHSRAAIPGMVMVAVMIWIGAVGFSNPRWQLIVMIVLTTLGIAMGICGLTQILSWNQMNLFGLRSSAFASFVSKNSAGGFLNVCLAASLGLSAWAFSHPRQREHRYAYAGDSTPLRIIRVVEDALAQLTTAQISAMIATTFLLVCVFVTNSRGAAISALAGCLVVLLLGRFASQGMGRWIFAGIIVALGLILMVSFELDTRFSQRFEELTSTNLVESDSKAGRIYIWGVAWKAFLFFWSTGAGLGTFHYAHLPFQNPIGGGWYYHAESMYMQALVDLGLVGAVLIGMIFYVGCTTLRILGAPIAKTRSRRDYVSAFGPIYVMSLALLVSQSVHSVVDFAMILPALFLPCGLVFGMLIGAAAERSAMDASTGLIGQLAVSETPSHKGRGEHRHHHRLGAASAEGQSKIRIRLPSTEPPVETAVPKPAPVIPWLSASSLVLAVVLAAGGIVPLDAMSRTKIMMDWLRTHNDEDLSRRIASPSAFLAGMWGSPWISIHKVPDALRMLAESFIYEFRIVKFEELAEKNRDQREVSIDETSPIWMRLEMAKRADELASQTPPEPFGRTQIEAMLGDEKQIRRWNKAMAMIEQAQIGSPLDWQLLWDRVLLDYDIDPRVWSGWMERARLVSRHVPQKCFHLGVLARRAAKRPEIAHDLWVRTLQASPGHTQSVAMLIAEDTPDDQIALDVFPRRIPLLSTLLVKPFDQQSFPKTHEKIWQAIEEIATDLDEADPDRAIRLALVAYHFGRKDEEMEHLEEAVRRNPLNVSMRLLWSERLAAAGDLKLALEQAEFCLTISPEDSASAAVVARIKEQLESARPKLQDLP